MLRLKLNLANCFFMWVFDNIFARKDMSKVEKSQYLVYDFIYEGIRHRAKIKLEEGLNGIALLYDDHDLEITWEKRIRHKGKHMIINIVIKEDWNDMDTLGKVVASAWVCVYDKSKKTVVIGFEPDNWSYIDEADPSNNTNKIDFYK